MPLFPASISLQSWLGHRGGAFYRLITIKRMEAFQGVIHDNTIAQLTPLATCTHVVSHSGGNVGLLNEPDQHNLMDRWPIFESDPQCLPATSKASDEVLQNSGDLDDILNQFLGPA